MRPITTFAILALGGRQLAPPRCGPSRKGLVVTRLLRRLEHQVVREEGAQLVEYGFLLVGIAIIVAVAAQAFGFSVRDALLLPLPWLS